MIFASILIGAALAAAQPATARPSAARCAMSADDRSWVDQALTASDYMMRQRLRLPPDARPTMVLFDKNCRFEARGGAVLRWSAARHNGKIRLPDGNEIDAGVTSFASRIEETGERFFVMALPTVWHAANVSNRGDSLKVTGVFLHEFSHTRQADVLQPHFAAAEAAHRVPDNLSDDAIQEHFQGDPAYVAVAEKETDLLYRAAREPDAAKAKALAKQALDLMEARQKRWFVGEDAKWKPYDDIFLTMEGFGQWVAYAWLSDPRGGRMTAAEAETLIRSSRRWWSQEQGLALFLIIDRFLPDWPRQAFGSRPALGIDMLRRAVAG